MNKDECDTLYGLKKMESIRLNYNHILEPSVLESLFDSNIIPQNLTFDPWPSEFHMKSGALAQIQALIEAGKDPASVLSPEEQAEVDEMPLIRGVFGEGYDVELEF